MAFQGFSASHGGKKASDSLIYNAVRPLDYQKYTARFYYLIVFQEEPFLAAPQPFASVLLILLFILTSGLTKYSEPTQIPFELKTQRLIPTLKPQGPQVRLCVWNILNAQ